MGNLGERLLRNAATFSLHLSDSIGIRILSCFSPAKSEW